MINRPGASVPGYFEDKHMRIRLLNDGGFHEIQDKKFPLEVEAERCQSIGYNVAESEFGIKTDGEPFFFLDSEVEVVK